MESISHHITPLVIHSLGGGHTHTHTHAYRHSRTEAIIVSNYSRKSLELIYKNFFSNRVINFWNQLPQYVIEADNVNSFKSRLDNYWTVLGYGYT